MSAEIVAGLYRGWHLFNDDLVRAVAPLTPRQLALSVGRAEWPIWASTSHLAGTRVYWLCHVFGEPGVETTPFTEREIVEAGWEDDLTHPRRADELVSALESSWRIVERTLASWTTDTLGQEARRTRDGKVQIHTRQSVLFRLLTHDAFHSGEISLVLGSNGLGVIEPWGGLSRIAM